MNLGFFFSMKNHFSTFASELTSTKPEQPYFSSSLSHAPGESVRKMQVVNVCIAKREMVIIFNSAVNFHPGDLVSRLSCFLTR